MRICPECKSKLKISEILKSLFKREIAFKCSKCNTDLTIKTNNFRIINAIIVGIVVFFCSFLCRWFNSLYGILIGSILGGILAAIIMFIVLFATTIIIGFKKR